MVSCVQVTVNKPEGGLPDPSVSAADKPKDCPGVPAYIKSCRPSADEKFKFFMPLLSWQVKEISLNWDCDTVVEKQIQETIGNEWENKEITLKTSGYSKRTTKSTGNLAQTLISVAGASAAAAADLMAPGVGAVISTVVLSTIRPQDSENVNLEKTESKFKEETTTKQKTLSNYEKKVSSLMEATKLKNPRLSVVVEFYNSTGEAISFKNPQIPVYSGDALIGYAGYSGTLRIQPRKWSIPVTFDCPLNNTLAIKVIDVGDWTADVLGAKGTFMTESGGDLLKEFSEDRKLYIAGTTQGMSVHFRDNGEKNSVRDFVETLNKQIEGVDDVEINGNWKYLKSVFGVKSGGSAFWQICVFRNGEKIPFSADDDLPKEDIYLCSTDANEMKRSWLEDGVKVSDPCALYWMGVCWEKGIDGEKDLKKAVEYFSALAKTDFVFPKDFKIRMGERCCYKEIDERKFSEEDLNEWKLCWENEVNEIKNILFKRWKGTKDDYGKIKQKCDYVFRYYGDSIQGTRFLKFANEYLAWLDSYNRKYQLHAKRCHRVERGHTYIDRIGWDKGKQRIKFEAGSKSGRSFEFIQGEPWEEVEISYRKKKRGFDKDQGTDRECLKKLGDLKLSGPHDSFEKKQLKITIRPLNGKTVHDLWEEIF